MKKIVCEVCSGTAFTKDDGWFICQGCGTKYSTADVKALMVDDGAEAPDPAASQGASAASDNSAADELDNLYQLARRAKESNNSENARKYYEMILPKDPLSWEANFYQVYYTAMSCKIMNIESAARSVSNCFDSVTGLVRSHVSESEQPEVLTEIVGASAAIATMLASAAQNHYNGISYEIRSNYLNELNGRLFAADHIMLNLGNTIEQHFGADSLCIKCAVDAWRRGKSLSSSLGFGGSVAMYDRKIAKHDSEGYLTDSIRDITQRLNGLKNAPPPKSQKVGWIINSVLWPVVGLILFAVLMGIAEEMESMALPILAMLFCFAVGIYMIYKSVITPSAEKLMYQRGCTIAQLEQDLERKKREYNEKFGNK